MKKNLPKQIVSIKRVKIPLVETADIALVYQEKLHANIDFAIYLFKLIFTVWLITQKVLPDPEIV